MAGLTQLGRFDWERIIRRIHTKPLSRCQTGSHHLPFEIKSLLLFMATYAAADGTRVFPGDIRLTAVTGRSPATLHRWRAQPVRLGLLRLERRGGAPGLERRASEYHLTVPDDLLETFCLLDPQTEALPGAPGTPLTQMIGVPAPTEDADDSSGEGTPLTRGGTPLTGETDSDHQGDRASRTDQGDQPHIKELDRYVGNARASGPPEADPEYDAARRTLMTLDDFSTALIADLRATLPNGGGLTDRDACVTAAELIREKRRRRNGRR